MLYFWEHLSRMSSRCFSNEEAKRTEENGRGGGREKREQRVDVPFYLLCVDEKTISMQLLMITLSGNGLFPQCIAAALMINSRPAFGLLSEAFGELVPISPEVQGPLNDRQQWFRAWHDWGKTPLWLSLKLGSVNMRNFWPKWRTASHSLSTVPKYGCPDGNMKESECLPHSCESTNSYNFFMLSSSWAWLLIVLYRVPSPAMGAGDPPI